MPRDHVGTQKSRQTRQKTTEKFGQVRFSSYLCTVQRNEGLAEAPHFYLYKRLKKDIPFEGNEVVPIEAKYVIWPVPDTETNLK